MRKFFRSICFWISCFFIMLSACTGYTDEEIMAMRAKLASFENSQNFTLTYSDRIWLAEKEVCIDELTYKGVQLDGLFGCTDNYFYSSIRTKSGNNYTIHLLKIDYDTLEMTEIGQVENLTDDFSGACTYRNNQLYFKDGNKYCVYDIETNTLQWFKYKHEEFWRKEVGEFSFEIKSSIVTITENKTGIEKQVSWKKDLSTFEEGRYIQTFDQKYTGFVSAAQRDGVCYLTGMVPLDGGVISYQIVIFAYDFQSEKLSYYGTAPYTEYNYPTLSIIYR